MRRNFRNQNPLPPPRRRLPVGAVVIAGERRRESVHEILPSAATLSWFRRKRHFDEVVPSRCCSIDSGHYFRAVLPYDRPYIRAEDNQSEFSTQLLLVTDVLIGGNHHVEPRFFRHP